MICGVTIKIKILERKYFNVKRLEIKDLFLNYEKYLDKEVTVCGWIKTIRNSKSIGFIELNDGSCFKNIQVVVGEDKIENYVDIIKA